MKKALPCKGHPYISVITSVCSWVLTGTGAAGACSVPAAVPTARGSAGPAELGHRQQRHTGPLLFCVTFFQTVVAGDT